jgi:hypothetical protein
VTEVLLFLAFLWATALPALVAVIGGTQGRAPTGPPGECDCDCNATYVPGPNFPGTVERAE